MQTQEKMKLEYFGFQDTFEYRVIRQKKVKTTKNWMQSKSQKITKIVDVHNWETFPLVYNGTQLGNPPQT